MCDDPVTWHGRDRRVPALFLLHAVLALMAVVYGFDSAWPAAWRGAIFRVASALALVGMTAILVLILQRRTWTSESTVTMRLAAALCLSQLGLSLFFILPNRFALPAIAVAWAGGAILAWRINWTAAVAWAMAAGFILYAGSIMAIPIDVNRADMLPFIAHAIEIFRAGGDPYLADFSVIDPNPFFYPPAQWLVFLPAQEFGIDLRVINLLSAAAIILLVERQARGGGTSLRAGVYPILLSPLALPMMHSGQVWPYWLAILGFGLMTLSGRWCWTAAIAATAIGLRQTALVPAAIVAIALTGRIRLGTWLRIMAVGTATLAVSFVPFVRSREALEMLFVDGPRRALAQAHIQGNPANQIAASNLLGWLGLESRDSRFEMGVAILMAVLAWFAARRGLRQMLAVAGIGYALTISANPYVHRYYYVAGVILLAIGLTTDEQHSRRRGLTADWNDRSEQGQGKPAKA